VVPRRLLAALSCAAVVGLAGAGPAVGAEAAPPQRTWSLDQAHVPGARAAGRDGGGVLIAVLDTWVDGSHPDLEGRVLTGADCTSGTCRQGPASHDPCTHGTHVAGTLASSSYGVAPRASLLPVEVLAYAPAPEGRPAVCSGSVGSVAAGIRYATTHGARVVNLSLGTLVPGLSSSSAIAEAVADAARAGVVVVFAAGNASVPVADSYGTDALVVAATGPSGALAGYSQRGAGVTLAAPGGDPATPDDCTPSTCVTSLYPGGRYAVAAGTSMAAPVVSGTAALLLAQDPSRTPAQVVARLRATARPLAGAGDGVVDAAAALSGTPAVRSAGPSPAAAAVPQAGVTVAPLPLSDDAAQPRERGLPPAPPVLAAALLVTAGVATTVAARWSPPRR
jgi:subtilisin family serine protease